MKRLLLSSMIALSVLVVQAQQTVSGRIVDGETGEGLIGASVTVKGTSTGTVTDIDGNYSLSVPDGATIVISYVGYLTQEIAVGSRTSIDVSLASDAEQLSELVVVGYGTQDKKEVTSAVASLGEEEFNNGNVTTAQGLLQGKVAGLSITNPGGDPNSSPTIRLRGLSTFGANSSPLIVIDGVVGASLDNLDPNDIETMDVLKDGSAAAIYGARGSSGVILITTKRGAPGESLSVDINSFVTVDNIANTIDVLSAQEFVDRGGTDYGFSTDWVDELTQTGLSHTQSVSIGGALGPNTTFRGSFSYRDNEGIVKGVGFERINTRLNISQDALDGRLRLQFNVATNNRDQTFINNAAFRHAIIYNPTAPVLEDGGDPVNGGYFQRDLFDFFNPIALAELQDYSGESKGTFTNYQAKYDVLDNLTVGVNYSMDLNNYMQSDYHSIYDREVGQGANGRAQRLVNDSRNELLEGTLDYSTSFGDVDVDILAGASTQVRSNDGFGVMVRNFLSDGQGADQLGFGGIRTGVNTNLYSYRTKDVLNSYFGRANFNLNNTYFLSATVRAESYSGFGENEKTGVFPAGSFGAQLTEIFDLGSFDQLKLRVSYGVTGNLPPSPYLAVASFGPGGIVDLDQDPLTTGDVYVVPEQTRNPNPSLKWETKAEFDVGVDFAIGNWSGTMDYYIRNISDLLFNLTVPIGGTNPFDPSLINTTNNLWANIADLSAAGFEFSATYAGMDIGPVKWTPSANFTIYDKTTIDNFSVGELGIADIRLATPGSPGQNNNPMIRNIVGETIGTFYGPEFTGVDESGNYTFASGQDPTDPETWVPIGNGLPDAEFGFSNSFQYGNWDMNFFIRGAIGHDLYNSYRGFYENSDAGSITWNSVTTDKTPSGDDEVLQSPTYSSLFVEDATFIRLDNAQIGYNFDVSGSDAFSKVRVYFAAQNLFTITNYSGIDPEVRYTDSENGDGFTTALAPGIERRNTYFTTRSFTFGVNISL